MIPTLAERSRRRQLQALALNCSWPARPVTAEPPLGLQVYLQPQRPIPEPNQQPIQRTAAEPSALKQAGPIHPLPAWLELILWLAVLLIEAAEAIRALRSSTPSQPRPYQRRWWPADQASRAPNYGSQQTSNKKSPATARPGADLVGQTI